MARASGTERASPVELGHHEGVVRAAEQRIGNLAGVKPRVSEADIIQRRAHGVALCSLSVSGPGRTMRNGRYGEDNLVDIEFREDGSIRVLVGRATYSVSGDYILIFEPLIVAYAVRLVGWAAALGYAVSYRGGWGLGLHASNLRNLPGEIAAQRWFTEAPRFNEEYHRVVTTAALADLEDRVRQVAGELVGGLLHALGVAEMFGEYVAI